MASQVLKGSGTVPEPTALNLRGVQTDAFGEVKGGHKALFDVAQTGETGIISSGDTISNLIVGGDPLICTSSGFLVPLETAKGIEFSNSSPGVEFVEMPAVFDLNTLGAEPSIVISTWITNKTVSGSGSPAVMGYAYQTGTYCQWSIAHENIDNTIAVRVNGYKYTMPMTLNEPTLITIVIEKSSDGMWIGHIYKNDTIVGSKPESSYPFKDPAGGASPSRSIGYIGGYAGDWDGIVHRLQLFKFDPGTFDAAQWIADEIANNSGRFVLP